MVGDGSAGLPERAPFDAIAVHATAPAPPAALIEQLALGGRLVVPIATDSRRHADRLPPRAARTSTPRPATGLRRAVIGPCRFVPLIGSEGYPE